MARTFKTIAGMTYQTLDSALSHIGYVREQEPNRVVYRYPVEEDAKLIFSPRPLSEEVRGIDLLAARSIVEDFGIMDAKDFDLLLVRLTGAKHSPVAN